MTGETEGLRSLVEACLDDDPVKHPSIVELSEKIKPLKVRDMLSAITEGTLKHETNNY